MLGSVVVLVFRYEAGYTEPLSILWQKGTRMKKEEDEPDHTDFVNSAILESLENLDIDDIEDLQVYK